MLESLLIALAVFAIAFMFAPVGMGGGMLFAPLLHYGADWPIDGTLLAASLCLTWVVSLGSGLRHRREGHLDVEASRSALTGAIIGALLGVLVVNALGDRMDVVFKLLSTAMVMWALVKTRRKIKAAPRSEESSMERTTTIRHTPLRVGAGVGGVLSTVLGIGAGVIYVPVLQQSADLEPRKAIGTSLSIMMVVVPVAILALLTSSNTGFIGAIQEQPWWFYTLPFLAYAGATSGAAFGIRYISPLNIMKVFMVLIGVILVRYLIDLSSLVV